MLHQTLTAINKTRQYNLVQSMSCLITQQLLIVNVIVAKILLAGSVLRIDLQGDKSKTTRRGFLISYTMTKDSPGFRGILY